MVDEWFFPAIVGNYRERRMRLLDYMLSLWNRFKGVIHRGVKLLWEEGWSIPMKISRMILKVSAGQSVWYLFSIWWEIYFFKIYLQLDTWLLIFHDSKLMKIWAFLFIGRWQVENPKKGCLYQRRGVGNLMFLIQGGILV